FETERALEMIQNKIQMEFPNYYDVTINQKIFAMSEVQHLMNQDSTLIVEYFYGDSAIYVLGIEKTKATFQRISKDLIIEQQLKKFIAFMQETSRLNRIKADFLEYQRIAFNLYQVLLKNILYAGPTKK